MGRSLGMVGPLARFAPGFSADLVRQGYRPGSVAAQLQLMGDASRWLDARGVGPGDLTEALVEQLTAERRASGLSRLFSSRAMSPLLEYLRGLGVVPPAERALSVMAVEIAVRDEEASGRVDTLLSAPIGRRRWLAGRVRGRSHLLHRRRRPRGGREPGRRGDQTQRRARHRHAQGLAQHPPGGRAVPQVRSAARSRSGRATSAVAFGAVGGAFQAM